MADYAALVTALQRSLRSAVPVVLFGGARAPLPPPPPPSLQSTPMTIPMTCAQMHVPSRTSGCLRGRRGRRKFGDNVGHKLMHNKGGRHKAMNKVWFYL